MKNTSVKIFALLSVLCAVLSCQQFHVDTQMTPEKFAASVKLVTDVQDAYTLGATSPQSIIFNVSSNVPWSITGAPEWLKVTPASSAASSLTADITVSASSNDTYEDRTATIVVKADSYDITKVVTITQNRLGKFFVQPIYKDYVAGGGPLTFTIETNLPWEVRSSAGWLTFGKSSGDPDPSGKPITVIATADRSDVMERTATVTVTSGDNYEEFEVVQKAHFDIVPATGVIPSEGGSIPFTVKTDLAWSVSSDQGWVSFDKVEGEGDGSAVAVQVIGAANDGAARKATVTVKAGGTEKTFEVQQDGVKFNIVVPDDPTIDRAGGDIIVEVNTTLDWTVSVEGEGFTAEKVDATHFKVSADWNGKFAPRKAVATILSDGGSTDSVELTQDINFDLSDGCTVQPDGSVKLDGSLGAKVYFKDGLRLVSVEMEMGEKSFGASGQFWFRGVLGGVNIYNILSLDGQRRIRTDGTMVGGASAYKSTNYTDITPDDLNSMGVYKYGFMSNADDPTTMDMYFMTDDKTWASHTGPNPFAFDEGTVQYWFGFNDAVSDGSWYVIKSVKLTINE